MNIGKTIKQSICNHEWGEMKLLSINSGTAIDTGRIPMDMYCICKRCGKVCTEFYFNPILKYDPYQRFGTVTDDCGLRYYIDGFKISVV